MSKESFLFTWREIVRDKDFGPNLANTRFVLFALSFFMNEHGNNCFPSIETLKDETKLSRPTIIKHLKIAVKDGWIKREYRGQSGQGWKLYTYTPVIPKDIINVVKQLNHVGEGGQIQHEGGKIKRKRWLNRAKKVVKQLYPNTSYNTSKNTSCNDEVGFSFLGEKTSSSENYVTKEQIAALKKTLSPVANKKSKISIDQRRAELKRQAEQLLENETPGTLLSEDFALQPEIQEHFYGIGGIDSDYLKSVFGKHKERLIRLGLRQDDWVDVFKRCFSEDKKSYPENYKETNEQTEN